MITPTRGSNINRVRGKFGFEDATEMALVGGDDVITERLEQALVQRN